LSRFAHGFGEEKHDTTPTGLAWNEHEASMSMELR